jgi:hypothetical protein
LFVRGDVTATLDPHVWIEEQRPTYTRYRCDDGRRWEVHGVCDHNRACLAGAVIDGVLIETVEQARALPTPLLDCPVGPGWKSGVCCDLRVTVL